MIEFHQYFIECPPWQASEVNETSSLSRRSLSSSEYFKANIATPYQLNLQHIFGILGGTRLGLLVFRLESSVAEPTIVVK